MSDLTDKRYEAILYLFRLCYRVIQLVQRHYRKNQVSILHITGTYVQFTATLPVEQVVGKAHALNFHKYPSYASLTLTGSLAG